MDIETKLRAYGEVQCDVGMHTRTTFRIGGKARYFISPMNELALIRILEILGEYQIAFKILGKGSNILFADNDYDGAIISLEKNFHTFAFEEDGTCVAQSGVSIILLAHEAMKQSLSGLEFASGIPGSVGGALYMNAGAYKSDISQLIQCVYVLKDAVMVEMEPKDLDYKYRHSLFQSHPDWVILGCRLKLVKSDQKKIKDLIDARRSRRLLSQPLDKPCAGSMFRNPEGYQAWELIEQVGLRGKRVGGAMISDKHANFIVNEDHATCQDVATLIELVQRSVKERFHVDLVLEVERFNWMK